MMPMEFVLDSNINARVAELVDALDLGSSGASRESSSLSFRTIFLKKAILSACFVKVKKQAVYY